VNVLQKSELSCCRPSIPFAFTSTSPRLIPSPKRVRPVKSGNMKLRAALQSNPRDKTRREERGLSLLVATVTTPREGAAYFKDIFPSMTFQLNKASRPHKISTLTVNTRPDDHPEFAALRAANEGDPRHKFVELSASPPVRNVSLSEGALSWGRITSQEVRLNYDLLEFLRITAPKIQSNSWF